jgi:LEA14-like dessication related protein
LLSLFQNPSPGHRTRRCSFSATLLLASLLLSGCANLSSGFENPTLSVNSFRLLPSTGMLPRFAIGLHIINPNRTPLPLQGLLYTIEIEGHKLITGVSNDLPVVAAYGEEEIELQASVNLLSGLRVFSGLMQSQTGLVNYRFSARLSIDARLPEIAISEHGQINLSAAAPSR